MNLQRLAGGWDYGVAARLYHRAREDGHGHGHGRPRDPLFLCDVVALHRWLVKETFVEK